jgi:hypothetical protein
MKFVVQSEEAPVVEIDSAARAVYVRFRKGKVARTLSPETDAAVVAVDLDRQGRMIGAELLGVNEFSLKVLLKKLPFLRADVPVERARYLPTPAPIQVEAA